MTLRGQVDRVDVDRERNQAAIRDYKARDRHRSTLGARHPAADRAVHARRAALLGLPRWPGSTSRWPAAIAAPRGLVREDAAERVGGVVANDVKDGDVFAAALEAAEATAAALADRLAAGELRPCPATCSPRGCAYPGVCRAGQP